jgi:hypothetical protein
MAFDKNGATMLVTQLGKVTATRSLLDNVTIDARALTCWPGAAVVRRRPTHNSYDDDDCWFADNSRKGFLKL